jgi:PAS domain S-box-containing protein
MFEIGDPALDDAAETLNQLARVFFPDLSAIRGSANRLPDLEARYRTLVEQIPAVVFMASLDEGIGEAYVSPQIESMLGFTQREWLEDPVMWYAQIHPEDKDRWSVEASQLFLSGEPLKSVYRMIARNGRTVWFHCEGTPRPGTHQGAGPGQRGTGEGEIGGGKCQPRQE